MSSTGVIEIEVEEEASFLILTGVVEIEVEEEAFFLTSIRVVGIEVEEEASFAASFSTSMGQEMLRYYGISWMQRQ